jgi:hypothetical protein
MNPVTIITEQRVAQNVFTLCIIFQPVWPFSCTSSKLTGLTPGSLGLKQKSPKRYTKNPLPLFF